MPGQTNNDIVIDALNQAIVAINEITATLPPGTDLTTVEANLALLAGYTDDIRVAIETESAAAITAQNTNFSDLQSIIANLKLVCYQQQKITLSNYFTPYTPEATAGGDGTPAPEPFQDLELSEEFVKDRKCFMATSIVDEFNAWLLKWDDYLIDEMLNLSFAGLFAALIATLAEAVVEVAIIGTVLATIEGSLGAIAYYLFNNIAGVEFSDISTVIQANRDDLICDLYEASDVDTARSDFIATLNNAGLSLVNQGFVLAALNIHYLNYLFYKEDQSIEAAYQIATGYDCTGCAGSCANRVPSYQTTISLTANQAQIQAERNSNPSDPAYYAAVYFDATEELLLCGGSVTITGVTIIGGTFTPNLNPAGVRVYSYQPYAGSSGDLYHSNQLPTLPIAGARVIVLKSSTQFTVQYDWS